MGWIITKDNHEEPGFASRVGVGEYIHDGRPMDVQWRTKDADGNVDFEGKISDNWINGSAAMAFAPLDFAMPDVGSVTMEYRKGDGPWQVL
jgi:hypothetical protein